MGHVLILGGTSDIGGEVAARLAPGNRVTLAARRVEALGSITARLTAAGATEVHRDFFDADDLAAQPALLDAAWEREPVDTAARWPAASRPITRACCRRFATSWRSCSPGAW